MHQLKIPTRDILEHNANGFQFLDEHSDFFHNVVRRAYECDEYSFKVNQMSTFDVYELLKERTRQALIEVVESTNDKEEDVFNLSGRYILMEDYVLVTFLMYI
jgi:hypothetical protein